MSKTKQPTGLSLARSGLAFTASWKIADKDYKDGQQIRYKFNSKAGWTTKKLGVKVTSYRIANFNAGNYYPYTGTKLPYVGFCVRGNADGNKGWSKWTGYSWTLSPPPAPSVSYEVDSYNQSTFTAKYSDDDPTRRPFARIYYQSILVRESQAVEAADIDNLPWGAGTLGWQSGTGGAETTITITEDTSLLAQGSYTRYVRFKCQGCAGESGWSRIRHVYAKPFTPTVEYATGKESSGVTTIDVRWTANADNAHPIDETGIQYAIDTPASGLNPPSGISPTDIVTSKDTSGADAWHGEISASIREDECLWVRVKAVHVTNESYSAWKLASAGKLLAPTGLTATLATRAVVSATNNSTVPDAHLAVIYRSNVTEPVVIGVIQHGSSSVTVPYPDDGASEATIGVYAFQGTYIQTVRQDGVYAYSITPNMTSDEVWLTNTLPAAPTNVVAVPSETQGEVILSWDWAWTDADVAELSWSQNPNAWESTDEPKTYELDNSHAARWRISELETGVTWYFRIRLAIKSSDDDYTFGPYSEAVEVDLASAPSIPDLQLSESVITEDGSVTATWGYITQDGTTQAYAEIVEATINGDAITYGTVLARVQGAQRVTISAQEAGWSTGETHSLAMYVRSASGRSSGWSDPVSVTIAEKVTCEITSTSLVDVTLVDSEGNQRTVLSLAAMPLSVTATGAGDMGTTRIAIERAADYPMDRPDEEQEIFYSGELIAVMTQTGEDPFSITREDLIGLLDDGAQYRIIATAQDSFGQSASDSLMFEVHWEHQALMPKGAVIIDKDNLVARITPIAPAGWAEGDTCDIYRLSADRPELIVQNGSFGETYVDPYPAIGETGGHRIVYKTIDGDYITEDNMLAWTDLQKDEGDYLDTNQTIIDFDGNQVGLEFNMTASHSWQKEFTETTYLGGSVQGDWSPGTHRTSKINAVMTFPEDIDAISALRRLATYSGICHIRTVDGSSFAADIQVSEDRGYDTAGKIVSFQLSITRVDPEDLDGMTLLEWIPDYVSNYIYQIISTGNLEETSENGTSGGRTFEIDENLHLTMTEQDDAVEDISFSMENGRLVVTYGD